MRVAVLLVLLASAPLAAEGATVTVLDPEGRPVAEAAVMCVGHETDPALTDAEGRAAVPAGCRVVSCMQGSYLPGRATVGEGTRVCRLLAGVRVTISLAPPGCGDGCSVGLMPIEGEGDHASREMGSDPDSGFLVARLSLVAPGAYEVVLHGGGWWACRSRIGLHYPGDETIRAAWRSPVEITGVVLDARGRPASGIPVRARAGNDKGSREPGGWRCEEDKQAPDVFTSGDGSFRLPIDPGEPNVIEAGSSWDPDGFASLEIVQPGPTSLVLQLIKGVSSRQGSLADP